jgi:hypothetical protein
MGPWEIFGVVLACIACIACGYILYRNLPRLLASPNRLTSENVEQFSGHKIQFVDGGTVDTHGAMGGEGGQLQGKLIPWTTPRGWVLERKNAHESVVHCVDKQLYLDSLVEYDTDALGEPFQAFIGPEINAKSIANLADID